MKKILLTLVCCLMSLTAFAQIKSIEIMADYRAGIIGPKGDPGIGVGLTWELAENFDVVPRFHWYLDNDATKFNAEIDFHYNFTEISDNFYLYPIVGGGLYHFFSDEHNRIKALANLGGGIGYPLNDHFNLFGEIKYQIIAGETSVSGTYISAGLSYCF